MTDNKEKSQDQVFKELNSDYQKCLNNFYDKFFEGTDNSNEDYSNICSTILEKMKGTSNLYDKMSIEFNAYIKDSNDTSNTK